MPPGTASMARLIGICMCVSSVRVSRNFFAFDDYFRRL
jgi:hypothetical protein